MRFPRHRPRVWAAAAARTRRPATVAAGGSTTFGFVANASSATLPSALTCSST
jgi:hypothetical protein